MKKLVELIVKQKNAFPENLSNLLVIVSEWDKIVNGRLDKFFSEVCLLDQSYIKDDSQTVKDVLNELIAKLGENITIKRFVRYQLGEELSH